MLPIMQTRFGFPNEHDLSPDEPPGNCYQACIASILGLELKLVPDIADCWLPGRPMKEIWERYFKRLLEWLSEFNLTTVEVSLQNTEPDWLPCYEILTGESPRANFKHSVVGWNGEIKHDPHPDNTGLVGGPSDWTRTYFVAIVPCKLVVGSSGLLI